MLEPYRGHRFFLRFYIAHVVCFSPVMVGIKLTFRVLALRQSRKNIPHQPLLVQTYI